MRAKGENPSYFWSCLFDAKEILKQWLYWRDGNVNKIQVFSDRWNRVFFSLCPGRTRNDLDDNELVANYIDQSTKTSKVDLIDNTFLTHEDAIIKSIHISRIGTEDKLICYPQSSGQYSVKSGYRFIKDQQEQHSL